MGDVVSLDEFRNRVNSDNSNDSQESTWAVYAKDFFKKLWLVTDHEVSTQEEMALKRYKRWGKDDPISRYSEDIFREYLINFFSGGSSEKKREFSQLLNAYKFRLHELENTVGAFKFTPIRDFLDKFACANLSNEEFAMVQAFVTYCIEKYVT